MNDYTEWGAVATDGGEVNQAHQPTSENVAGEERGTRRTITGKLQTIAGQGARGAEAQTAVTER